MITSNDHILLTQKGISAETVEKQIKQFEKGFPFMDILKPATVGDGIKHLDSDSLQKYISEFEKHRNNNLLQLRELPHVCLNQCLNFWLLIPIVMKISTI